MSLYDFTVTTIAGEPRSLADYKGSVLLIVNTASKCGLTPQYKGLQELYESNHAQDFEVLGFPCNQFKAQEPGTHEEIASFCERNYGVSFPMFSKIDVNGPNAHPLYKYLIAKAPSSTHRDIEWNFAKFLVDRDGNVVKRYSPDTLPEQLTDDIKELLKYFDHIEKTQI